MEEQYFGAQELYQVTLRANTHMTFGDRTVCPGEVVAYFDNIKISQIDQSIRPITARGGWGNLSRVIWEDRNELTFNMNEGVITNTGMSILFSSVMKLNDGINDTTFISHREGPFETNSDGKYRLKHIPYASKERRIFCYEYKNNCIQNYVDDFSIDIVDKKINKDITKKYAYINIPNSENKQFMLDYYFKYGDSSLLYIVGKEDLKGTFYLEGKYYTKDENYGKNVTNIITMPKVKIVSNVNLRLGETVSPTTSEFNMIAMPVRTEESDSMLMKIVRLNEDIDEN